MAIINIKKDKRNKDFVKKVLKLLSHEHQFDTKVQRQFTKGFLHKKPLNNFREIIAEAN